MIPAALLAALGRVLPSAVRPAPAIWPVVSEIAADIRRLPHGKWRVYRTLRKRFAETEAKALTLRVCNLLLARWHARNRSTRVTSRPYGLILDPSNMCQLACPGCVHSTRNEALGLFDWKPGTLTEPRFSALLRTYGPWATGVYLCNYGEPLLNMSTPRLIRMCKTYLLHVALSTSLSVKRFDADAYVDSGLDMMNMSIDGATQETYARYRRNGDIQLVFQNIRSIVAARRRHGRNTPVIAWNFLAFEHNKHEIPLAAAKARELGVDQFCVHEPFDVSWDDPNIHPATDISASLTRHNWLATPALAENWNPFPDSLESAIIDQAFDEPMLPPDEPASASTGHTCSWLYKNVVMDATGRILPCCCAPTPHSNMVFTHFDPTGPEPLADPFNSPMHQLARAHFAGTHQPSANSPYCTQCQWNQETVNIDKGEVARYFQFGDPQVFDLRSLDLLTNW